MFKRRFVQIFAMICFVTGPCLSRYITPSVHEQPAIWCYYSVVQVSLFAFLVRYQELYKVPPPTRLYHAGQYGEKPLTYILDTAVAAATTNNGNSNGYSNNGDSTLPLLSSDEVGKEY
jgi:hypothetical protein